ncbi:MAG: glycosyl hydrolase [Bacteroidetes bacterium]|nr:glycosyl hydrolase [Bacteroidota bacterium]
MKRYYITLLLFLPFFVLAQKTSNAPAAPEPKGTPATERIAGLEKRTETEKNSIVTNLSFRNVGPTVMSGRVVDIDINPFDPTKFYVAYASGGVWYTDNNGTTFTPIFDDQPLIDIGDIAVDWTNQDHPEIWVGTGEPNSSRSSYAGMGIYHSKDAGKTWENKGLAETHHIGKILLSPNDKKTIFIAAAGHLYTPNKERGVFKSTDGGTNWKQTLFIDENTGVIDMFFDPKNSEIIYAVAWHRERKAWNFVEGGKSSGIYKSTNSGENWTLISTPSSGFPNGDGLGRIGLSIFPGNTNIIYAVVDNQSIVKDTTTRKQALSSNDFRAMTREQFLALDNKKLETYLRNNNFPEKYSVEFVRDQISSKKIEPIALADFVSDANSDLFSKPIIGAEIYRSDDAGATWKKTNTKSIEGLFYTYGYYFGKIWVSPFDVNEVYIAGVELLKSTNGGKSFQSTNGENQHGDHHALWIDPVRKGHIINGNDGGVNISWDNGATWFKANTPSVGQFYSVNVDMATPYNVYGGLQDNGVWCGPNDYSPSLAWLADGEYPFKRILDGDGMQVQVDTRDNVTCYAGYQFGHYFRLNRAKHSEKEIHPEMELGDKPLRFNWQAPIWLSVHNQDILYIGAQKLYRSLDQGNHFTAISGDLTRGGRTGDVPYGTISAICESPMKFGLLYAGSDDGLIHVSKDGGNTWTRISDKLPQNLRVNRVIASAHVEGRVYAVLSGFQWDNFKPYLFVSENYGDTWTAIGLDLPMEPINVLREDPVNEKLIFIGTDQGLYASLDRGKMFMRMFTNLPPVAVHDLVIQTREHDLVVGTHGRSILIAHIGELELLNDSIRTKDLFVYETGTIKQQVSFDLVNSNYVQFNKTNLDLTWYTKISGPTKIILKSSGGTEVYSEMIDTSEVGLNFYNAVLSVDSIHAEIYQSFATNAGKDEITKLPHGKLSLLPGDYLIEFEMANGLKQSIKIKIIKPSPQNNNQNIPLAPGESEGNEIYIDK